MEEGQFQIKAAFLLQKATICLYLFTFVLGNVLSFRSVTLLHRILQHGLTYFNVETLIHLSTFWANENIYSRLQVEAENKSRCLQAWVNLSRPRCIFTVYCEILISSRLHFIQMWQSRELASITWKSVSVFGESRWWLMPAACVASVRCIHATTGVKYRVYWDFDR